ncbi:MAG: efflux RND transporter periplasmic adaptor subunit [Cuneatibacter sp.]|nr:efflux RND transporter periplasmic adaptor subunit [Cuneatibacter sp.]
MKNKKVKIGIGVAVAIVVIVALILVVLFVRSRKSGGQTAHGESIYVDSVAELTGMNVGTDSTFTGEVEAQKTVDIKVDSDKKVAEIYVEEGQEVEAGAPLFRYDVDALSLSLDQAKLEIEGIQNKIQTLNNQLAALQKEKNAAPASEQLSYSLQIQDLQLQVRTEEYNQTSKQAEADRIQKSIDNAEVTSTIAGTVKTINENGGTDNFGNEQPFMSILSKGNYQIKCKASELNVGALSEGMEMTVISRVDPEQTWNGKIDRIDREAAKENNNSGISYGSEDTMTQASKYYFYITLDNYDGLMLGQHVYAKQQGSEQKDGLWLSEYYLNDADGDAWVWAESADGRIERRSVELGEYDADQMTYEIVSGLSAEDYIAFPSEDITEGAQTAHYSDAFLGGDEGGVTE